MDIHTTVRFNETNHIICGNERKGRGRIPKCMHINTAEKTQIKSYYKDLDKYFLTPNANRYTLIHNNMIFIANEDQSVPPIVRILNSKSVLIHPGQLVNSRETSFICKCT